MVGEDVGWCTLKFSGSLKALELTSIMASAFLAKSLRLVVDDPARMRHAYMGSWARKWGQRMVLGFALRDFMWRRRLVCFLSPRFD